MNRTLVKDWLTANNLTLTDAQYDLLDRFQHLVLTANEKMNLTRIISDDDFAVKHFIDSFTLLTHLPPPQGDELTLLDIGTGAGFPGVPLLIARGDIRAVLVDSTRKRIDFVSGAIAELGLTARCLHANARELPRLLAGEKFNIVTARAVAALDKLSALALPLVKNGGAFLAMKGQNISQEITTAAPILKTHFAHVEDIIYVKIAPDMIHTIISIRKDG